VEAATEVGDRMKSEFMHAVVEAMEQLERRDYDPKKGIIYTHPVTYKEGLENVDYIPYDESPQVYGVTIEKTANVPEDMVILVHLAAMRLGPKAIAFSEVDNA